MIPLTSFGQITNDRLKVEINENVELLGLAYFIGYCGALTAGVLALNSATSEIENSYLRIARMNRLLRSNSNDAMNEETNNFNRSISQVKELSR